MARRLQILSLVPALLFVAACDTGTVSTNTCSKPEDCPAGKTCANGRCIAVNEAGITFPDGGTMNDGGACPSGVSCAGACCKSAEACRYNTCVETPTPCTSDTDCINDRYCDNGECIPWGLGPKGDRNKACTYLVPIGLFSPAKQCSWTAPPAGDTYSTHKNVLGTPTVADFNLDGDAKVRKPSIVFVSYNGEDGGGEASRCDNGYHGVIRVIDGETCTQQHTVDMAKVRASSPLALGDVDLDGRPDIVAARCGGGLVAFGYDATTKAFKLLWTSSPSTTGGTVGMWDGPQIHDLDDDGKPEILLGGTVWSSTGKLLDGALGLLTYSAGFIPVAADLDGDGKVELVNGTSVWTWTGGKWTLKVTSTTNTAGQVAVADFGTYGANPAADDRTKLDGVAEIAVISTGTVRVQTIAGRVVFGPTTIPGGGQGGPPTIGDFDKDGRAEIAAASKDSYNVFDPDCGATPVKTSCPTLATTGILWSKTSQDHSSNVTGSSIFDFEGDGAAEAIYSDECFTRVYDGKSGEVLYSQWRTSCTWYENPIVADVDGDFNSELVVPSNTNCVIDTTCKTNTNHDKHPTSGLTLDPLFKGLRCKKDADCLSGSCDSGYCRCKSDAECGGGGFVCAPVVTGTPGTGQVCRAAFMGDIGGLLVYRDALDRWVSSRMIWNQHAYSVTNINEDGTVPKTSAWKLNWKQPGLNNFRQNVQGNLDPTSTPDLTANKNTTLSCDKESNMLLSVQLCNRGTQPVAAGIPVTFYLGNPQAGQVICTAKSVGQLDPGKCEKVSCTWKKAPSVPTDVYVVADDDGTGKGSTTECEEGNNLSVIKGANCKPIG